MPPDVAYRSRSDRAFERLYRRHAGDVYRYALAVLANPADAEDVTQTAFLNAYRALQNGQSPARPLNWLIRIAHNVCRQRFRDGERRPKEVVLDPELASGPAEDGEGRYRREDILRALSQLNLNQRAALVMRELEGRSYAEIAEILDASVGSVETLIFRARRAFREQLEGSLTCGEAELAISRNLDGELGRAERGKLRAHIRSCGECATLARRFRAQRAAFKGIALVPLPQSLAGFSVTGGSGAAGGVALGGLGLKAAAVGASALLVAGVSYETGWRTPTKQPRPAPRAAIAPAPVSKPFALQRLVSRTVVVPAKKKPTRPARGRPVERRGQIRPGTETRSGGGHAVQPFAGTTAVPSAPVATASHPSPSSTATDGPGVRNADAEKAAPGSQATSRPTAPTAGAARGAERRPTQGGRGKPVERPGKPAAKAPGSEQSSRQDAPAAAAPSTLPAAPASAAAGDASAEAAAGQGQGAGAGPPEEHGSPASSKRDSKASK